MKLAPSICPLRTGKRHSLGAETGPPLHGGQFQFDRELTSRTVRLHRTALPVEVDAVSPRPESHLGRDHLKLGWLTSRVGRRATRLWRDRDLHLVVLSEAIKLFGGAEVDAAIGDRSRALNFDIELGIRRLEAFRETARRPRLFASRMWK